MNFRAYCGVSAILFSVVALAHLTRLFYGWSVQVDDVVVPMFVSWIGSIVPGALALWGFSETRRTG